MSKPNHRVCLCVAGIAAVSCPRPPDGDPDDDTSPVGDDDSASCASDEFVFLEARFNCDMDKWKEEPYLYYSAWIRHPQGAEAVIEVHVQIPDTTEYPDLAALVTQLDFSGVVEGTESGMCPAAGSWRAYQSFDGDGMACSTLWQSAHPLFVASDGASQVSAEGVWWP